MEASEAVAAVSAVRGVLRGNTRTQRRVVAGTCVAVMVAALAFLVLVRPSLVEAMGLAAAVILAGWILDLQRPDAWPVWLGTATVFAAVIVALVAVRALLSGNLSASWTFAGAIGFYLVLGAAVAHARDRLPGRVWIGAVIVAASTGAGLWFLERAARSEEWGPLLGVAGAVVVAPIGLGFLAEAGARSARWPPWSWAIGGALVLSGGVGLGRGELDAVHAAVLAAGLVVLVAAVCSAASHDILLVVVIISVLWALEPSGGGAQPDPEPGSPAIVAIGDSYMSGEGANEYYEGTNHTHPAATRNECRRAPTAYPVRAHQILTAAAEAAGEEPMELLFLACSGARARHLTHRSQYRGDPVSPWTDRGATPDEGTRRGQPQLVQATEAMDALDLDPKVVVVQIGGNDAEFGSIGQTCGLPGDCSTRGSMWLRRVHGLRDDVRRAYARIRATFPAARVLVVPYPVPLSEDGCSGSLLRDNEHRFLAGFTRALNRVLREEAATSVLDFDYLGSNEDVFARAGKRVCDTGAGNAAVNQLAASPIAGVFLQQVSPRGWFHNTFHPNETGHDLVARDVADWIAGTTTDHPPPGDVPMTVEGIMGSDFEHCGEYGRPPERCRVDRSAWGVVQSTKALEEAVVPVLLLVAGAYLLSVSLMRWWRQE